MTKTIVNNVKSRIIEHGQGWCFTPQHFIDLDSDTGVRSTLSRLVKSKVIRRLAQGIYDYPREHPILGLLPPKPEEVVRAISHKNGIQAQPSGAYAANLIGLSEQMPGRIVFLTNGPSKEIKIGNQTIIFRTAAEKTMRPAGTKIGLVIQALKNIGKEHIDSSMQIKIRQFLAGTNQTEYLRDLKYAPQWIRALILTLIEKNV